jgi:hypothetical protein
LSEINISNENQKSSTNSQRPSLFHIATRLGFVHAEHVATIPVEKGRDSVVSDAMDVYGDLQGLPQTLSNQRPTIALLSCSRDIFSPLNAVHKGVLAFWRGVSTSEVGVVDIRFLRFDSDGLEDRRR